MKKFFALTAVIFGLTVMKGQQFNGSIEFRYLTQQDTTTNVYHVKDDVVKLDQYSKRKDNTVEGSFLFDLGAGEIKFLNPKRKLWGRQKNDSPQNISGTCKVTKGKGVKTIAGQKCSQYTVVNENENTSITYWIAEEDFNFFMPLIQLWNRKDKQSIYFGQIKDLKQGSMPMMSEEKQLDSGKTLTKLEVTKVTRKQLPEELFMVPKDYSKFDQ